MSGPEGAAVGAEVVPDLIDVDDVPGTGGRSTPSTDDALNLGRDDDAARAAGAGDGDGADAGAGDRIDPTAERRALLELLIYAWDRARSPGVWERLTAGLAGIGVRVERPDGAAFDPSRHEVGGIQPTDDDALVDTIAETEVVGFTDRGVVLREPIVVVYRRG